MYATGDKIIISNCLGAMTCMGNNVYTSLEQYGGVCPSTKRSTGQTGCLFNGRIYNKNDIITISHCLAQMECLGFNAYRELKSLGGICPVKDRRDVNGQTGCLFDGTVYAANEEIIIPSCLGKMTCLGNNNLGPITSLYGICPQTKRSLDGQSGCLFDGTVYAKGDVIPIKGTNARLVCQGHNVYTEQL
ncbi:uncharacterized protein LOC127736271 isoform X3 [Mytilus californianus]|uniref:uncharacterized protein LOC127736271 isoform X2 n=1 Tax=Mytilus californianus TaxID=6549 RepID=UPI002247B425|nr:uncharacterized protein LOC127736271 isoform X2 [Mytilus californianus]XP_052102813.1 uncharacterized protein LOC127736271 isoform X3 [Mytilus californianus]